MWLQRYNIYNKQDNKSDVEIIFYFIFMEFILNSY